MAFVPTQVKVFADIVVDGVEEIGVCLWVYKQLGMPLVEALRQALFEDLGEGVRLLDWRVPEPDDEDEPWPAAVRFAEF